MSLYLLTPVYVHVHLIGSVADEQGTLEKGTIAESPGRAARGTLCLREKDISIRVKSNSPSL